MRSWLISVYALLAIALLLAVALSGCASLGPSTKIGNGSFVFIEYHDTLRSKVNEGNLTAPLILDDPLYLYDARNRTISFLFSADEVRNTPGLKALYGETVDCVPGGAVVWGTAQCYPVDHIPAIKGGVIFGSASVVINDIKEDGTVSLLYRNASITLKPGESWTGTWSDLEQLNTPGRVIVDLNRSESITNHGIFNFSQVRP
jgi:uncharacterized protein YceK